MLNPNEINMNEIRQISEDGKFIQYDLTKARNKLKPASVCPPLAKDVFQFSAKKWVSFIDNEMTFFPDSQITIRWPFRKGMKTNSLEEKFFYYLRKDNVIPHFQKRIDSVPNAGFSAVSLMVGGVAGAVLDEFTNSSNAKAAFISKITSEIRKNISFEYKE